jgi:hypothetical protein
LAESRGLESLNAIDVNQGDVCDAVRVGIDNHHLVPADGGKFRVANLVDLSIRESQLERLEWLADEPVTDGFSVH